MSIAGVNSTSNNFRRIRMDFQARRYDTFSHTFVIKYYNEYGILTELDLTGANIQMQVRKRKSDISAALIMDVAHTGNEITISKAHSEMTLKKGTYWHDMEIKDADGVHITWIEGTFVVAEHVTRFVDEILYELKGYLGTAIKLLDGITTKTIISFSTIAGIVDAPTFFKKIVFATSILLSQIPVVKKTGKILLSTSIKLLDLLGIKIKVVLSTYAVLDTTTTYFLGTQFTTKVTVYSTEYQN